ncbi:MAG TPA: G1 family glutamic endopeptidase [Acidimicrobiales bacterium]|nr:G1 family glutamic endopeptidase [Acidimicrobiales bacterium]
MKRRFGLAALVLVAACVPSGAVVVASTPAIAMFHPPIAITMINHDSVSSSNWSGYAAESSSQFTDVVSSWVQPTVLCKGKGRQFSSFWVGLDGYSSNSVEQLGTDSDCAGRGSTTYYGWYEMYPASSINLPPATYPVSAGDTLTAQVTRSGTSYTLSLHSSRGWTFSTHQTGSNPNSSAEWIAEAPTICRVRCRQGKLADFGSVNFSGADAATGGADQAISAFTDSGGPHDITMTTNKGVTRAMPSVLTAGGSSFSETWSHS